jgi:CRP-like cAMP-binding protein
MLAARQLKIVETCHERSHRSRRKNSDICSEVVDRLAAFAIPLYQPKGAALFGEGQPSRGVFILYSGRVKLFTSSAEGKTLILRFADPGEILGLAGTLSGQPYEAWQKRFNRRRLASSTAGMWFILCGTTVNLQCRWLCI